MSDDASLIQNCTPSDINDITFVGGETSGVNSDTQLPKGDYSYHSGPGQNQNSGGSS